MILINELKGKIRAKGYTQEKLANELGISPKTLSNKFNKGIFGSNEIEEMIEILDIDNPIDIFFAK
ncbi:helix-turn-helix transcriptional regulator [Clostridium botulinum]|nr:helix-turn-helix transcriptional regulator [Clostridium botulinum]NFP28401.1 helix-turn-helix transcriptional regulator [Clostridium botulinum]